LVFEEPIEKFIREQQHAAGLVLTEWKIAKSKEDASAKFHEAREQAKIYAADVLLGTELTAYRYAIVVSLESVDIPDPIKQGDVEYRHINIAVDRSSPSRLARQRRRTSTRTPHRP
jgi:hypothetical protein